MKTDAISRRTFLTGSALLSAAALVPACFAQRKRIRSSEPASDWQSQIDRIVETMMQQQNVPGVVVAVVRDAKVAYKKGYGVRKMEGGDTPDENTVFYIGSLSKALTAVGAMLLVQDGKLDLDARAARYINDLPQKWRDITVKQFMSHTSGIPEIGNRKKKAQENISAVYAMMAEMPMAFAPGTKEIYNNFNFAVTGDLIARISSISYIDYMTPEWSIPSGLNTWASVRLAPRTMPPAICKVKMVA